MTATFSGSRGYAATWIAIAALAGWSMAGCGGSSDDQSEAEKWADRVCSAVGTWQGAIDDTKSTLSDTSNLSAATLQDAVDDLASATDTMVGDLEDAGVPDADAGDEAKKQLNDLSQEIQTQADAAKAALDQSADSVSDVLANASAVTTALSSMAAAAGSTLESISKLDGGQELKDAIDDTSSCQDLDQSTS